MQEEKRQICDISFVVLKTAGQLIVNFESMAGDIPPYLFVQHGEKINTQRIFFMYFY